MQIEIQSPRLRAPLGSPRGQGVHVSSVIRVLATLNGILKPSFLESLDLVDRSGEAWWNALDPVAQIRMSMGLAWEHYYINNQLRDSVVHQPGEMCVEGLYMNHDGEGLETILSEHTSTTVMAVHEVKLTYKSWNTIRAILDQWMWMTQIKAYCKGLGTTVAYLHVLCVCGDYSRPISPLIRVVRLQFTELEIQDNWEMLTSFARHLEQQEAEKAMQNTYDARGPQ